MASPHGREQPYDPYIPAGGSAGAGNPAPDGGNQRTAALQAVSSENATMYMLWCIEVLLVWAATWRHNNPRAPAVGQPSPGQSLGTHFEIPSSRARFKGFLELGLPRSLLQTSWLVTFQFAQQMDSHAQFELLQCTSEELSRTFTDAFIPLAN